MPTGLRIAVLSLLVSLACHARVSLNRIPTDGDESSDISVLTSAKGRHDSDVTLWNRAGRLWQARRERDWAVSYEFEEPKVRERMSLEDYVVRAAELQPFNIESFELIRAESKLNRGWALVRHRSSLKRFPDVPARQVEMWQKWRRIDRQWYPVPPRELLAYPEAPALRDADQENRLKRRFEESWRYRRTKEWPELYRLCDPRDRATIDEKEFNLAEGMIDYLSHDLDWVEVIGRRGRIRVGYRHKLADPSLTKLQPTTTFVIEYWVKRGDSWYRDMKRP